MVEINIKNFTIPFLILLLIVLTFLVIKPIIIPVIFGLILGYIFSPLYKKFKKLFKEKNLSAALVVVLVLFILILPIWFFVSEIFQQIFDAYIFIQKIDLKSIIESLFAGPSQVSTDLIVTINGFVSKSASILLSGFSDFITNLPSLLIGIGVTLFIFFFTLRDTDKLEEYIRQLSPFNRNIEERLFSKLKEITRAVIFGHIVIGLIQGLLTGLGLWIFGFPQPLLFTLLAMFLSILPFFGAWLVWVPASIYLFATGNTGAGIGLFLFGAILVSWIDNFIRPYLVSRRAKIHSAVVFVGMVGGLIVFGVIGLIIGPLILSYMLMIIDIYKEKKEALFVCKEK